LKEISPPAVVETFTQSPHSLAFAAYREQV